MKPTIEILENIKRNSKRNNEEEFTKLYRYMLRPDLYYLAYKNLYSNNGESTKGVNEDTADGFSSEKIGKIILSLKNETYKPKPCRRVYIKKSNGKKRPLGIPTFTDKLVQEVLRMILEAVYEPVFLDCSHGFRPKRSCHTALRQITRGFNGIRWFVEGDIKGCFDNINHQVLVELINTKIKDARIIKLIWKILKAGYMENWRNHNTYSGTPQGGIISPLLSNIYLHELDKFVTKLAKDFDKPRQQLNTTKYNTIRRKMYHLNPKIEKATSTERKNLIKEKNSLRAELFKTPCKSQTDKKIKYVRYADDFLLGVNGNKEDCIWIKKQLSDFISGRLKMELSEDKTLITHSSNHARFLGYNVQIRRNNEVKPNGNHKQRTLSNTAELTIPLEEKITKFLFDKGIVWKTRDGRIKPRSRNTLIRCSDLEILSTYNSEVRGISNYYSMASNFNKLNYFAYLMEYSCLKTIAGKHKSRVKKIIKKYKDVGNKWSIPYKTKSGEKRMKFARFMDCKNSKYCDDILSNAMIVHKYARSTFETRLSAKKCELCGTENASNYEIHHVHKIKDLKGKAKWEQMMIAKQRKTMVLCEECHKKIHKKRVSK